MQETLSRIKKKILGYYTDILDRKRKLSMNDFMLFVMDVIEQEQEKEIDGWIPVTERMPEEYEEYRDIYNDDELCGVLTAELYMVSCLVNVTVKDIGDGGLFAFDDYTIDGKWCNFGSDPYEVVAWQPLPEPYIRGVEDEQ